MKPNASFWLRAVLAGSVLLAPLTASAEPSDQLSPSEHRQLQNITEMSGGTIQIKWDEQRGTPRFISGKLSKPLKGEPLDMAYTFLDSIKELYHVDKVKRSFRLKRVDQDELGMKHVRLTHLCNDIPVWGDEIIVHIDKTGVVRSVNGQFTPKMEANTERIKKPVIDQKQAITSALADLKIEQPQHKPSAHLFYFPYPDPNTITLTYVVSVHEPDKPADWKVFVDAITGDVVHKYNDIKFKTQRSK